MSALQPLTAHDLSTSYGDRVVLSGLDIRAGLGQPVGVVGENGVGKSTLLRLLAGVEQPDSGSVKRPSDLGYLAQELTYPGRATVAEVLSDALAPLHDAVRRLEALAHDLTDETDSATATTYAELLEWAQHHEAWDADRRAEEAAARLGLESIEPDRPVHELSGGERTRLSMAALITRRPECVVVDEPTNHLDDGAIEFLESFLLQLPGVVVVASHDRVLLDRVCAVVVDLDASHFGTDGAGGNRFSGGFSTYLAHKRAARQRWERAFRDQQDELNALRSAVRTTARQVGHGRRPPRDNDKHIAKGKVALVQTAVARRVRNAEQRIAALERELVPKPPAELSFDRRLTTDGGAGVFLRDLEVAGRLRLPRLDVADGEHLLVTGANGSGKSTLLALLAGDIAADAGTVRVSARAVGLLRQDVIFADPALPPHQVYDDATGSPVPLGELGLLHPRDLGRPSGVLSVGQQRRLALAILVAQQPDLLLLDEPTNHISLSLASELEDALGRSPGTVILASHDRWLRRHWAGRSTQLHS
ncbi:MAG: ABC-F family ATP-binding cassette domain-containing protein [Nocardioidaceae bacterium]